MLILNTFFLCMIVSISPFVEGASLFAESDPPTTCTTEQSQVPLSLAEVTLDNLPIILAGAGRDQCRGRCDSDRQSCVDSCPRWDVRNAADPKYVSRNCKIACDTDLSQCNSRCPNN